MGIRGRDRTFRRTRLTATASALAVGGAVLLAPHGVAQEPPPAPETGEIRNGTAKAVATVARVAPGVGELSLGMTSGTAVSQVTNALAQSTSQMVDLGLIGSSLTSESCSGSAAVQASDLPQPTFVDNRGGDTSAHRDEAGTDGQPAGAGRMEVDATAEPPEGNAHATAATFGIPGVLQVTGGKASASTRVLPGEGREAVATVISSIGVPGVLELEGLRWHARHRTGVEPLAEGSFDAGRVEVADLPIPADDLGAVEDAVNGALAELGVQVRLPRVQRTSDPVDMVRVTPLRIEMRDSAAGAAVLGPVLDITREQRSELFDAMVDAVCQAASAMLIGDVAVSVLAGTGFLTVEIGGVEASSADLEIGDPFGDAPPLAAGPPASPELAGGPELAPAAGGSVGPPGAPSPPSTVATTGPAAPPAAAAQSASAVDELCESLHPNEGGCSDGAAATVGVLGLLATAGVAGADVVRQRRQALAGEV